MTDGHRLFAVLTGDVVGSTKLAGQDLQRLLQGLRLAANRFDERFPNSVFGQLDVFSGDSWQLALQDPARSLRAAVYLRAVTRGDNQARTDTRIAVAMGRVDPENLNPERVSESMGEAFTRSGRHLKDIGRNRHLVMAGDQHESPSDTLPAAVGLLDFMVTGWTPVQAESMSLALLGLTQSEMAARLGKGQSTVNKSLQTAGLHPIMDFIAAFENRF